MKQYIKNKPHKWGIKLWVLACSHTGYVWRFRVYAGKQGEACEHELSYWVVIDLQGLLYKFHRDFMDNFYSSIPLFVDLFTRGVYAIGTMCRNRSFCPLLFSTVPQSRLWEEETFCFGALCHLFA